MGGGDIKVRRAPMRLTNWSGRLLYYRVSLWPSHDLHPNRDDCRESGAPSGPSGRPAALAQGIGQVTILSSRPLSIPRRISIAIRRPVLMGRRQSEFPYGWPIDMWTFVPPPMRGATS